MEKIERLVYGLSFFLGGVFLIIFMGVRLIDLLSKRIFYFMLIFFIVLILYGVFLILVGILMMSIDARVKKSVALILFLIGILIIILSISVIILDSFTNVNVVEILSGLGLIVFGISLFFHRKKLEDEGKNKKEGKRLGFVLLVIGLIFSLSHGFSIILIMISYEFIYVLYQLPFLLPPFLIGIILLIYAKYSVKITGTPQKKKIEAVLPILRGAIIVLILLYILFLFLFTRIEVLFY